MYFVPLVFNFIANFFFEEGLYSPLGPDKNTCPKLHQATQLGVPESSIKPGLPDPN
jgi:hypothetical protein